MCSTSGNVNFHRGGRIDCIMTATISSSCRDLGVFWCDLLACWLPQESELTQSGMTKEFPVSLSPGCPKDFREALRRPAYTMPNFSRIGSSHMIIRRRSHWLFRVHIKQNVCLSQNCSVLETSLTFLFSPRCLYSRKLRHKPSHGRNTRNKPT
jgi:hypothetical protein